MPDWPIPRTILALGAGGAFVRLISIVRKPKDFSAAERVLTTALPFLDPRHITRAKSTLRSDLFLVGAIEAAIAVALFIHVGTPAPPYHNLLRTFVGGASAYFFVDSTARIVWALVFLLGFSVEKPHDAPILARSVSEFWGKRWNRIVNRWLLENTFRPMAARFGVTAGIITAFGASALLHFVPIALVTDPLRASWMASFFLLHGVFVVVESKLGIANRVLTILWFVVTLPLFVEPMLEALGR
jgi:hypothetical protein